MKKRETIKQISTELKKEFPKLIFKVDSFIGTSSQLKVRLEPIIIDAGFKPDDDLSVFNCRPIEDIKNDIKKQIVIKGGDTNEER